MIQKFQHFNIFTQLFLIFYKFLPTGSCVNIYKDVKRISDEIVAYCGNRFVKYSTRSNIVFYRCTKYPSKCLSKIRINPKEKEAMKAEYHNHSAQYSSELSTKSQTKSLDESNDDLQFSKDVTTEVELITNDKNTTVLFRDGFKFTKYFENHDSMR